MKLDKIVGVVKVRFARIIVAFLLISVSIYAASSPISKVIAQAEVPLTVESPATHSISRAPLRSWGLDRIGAALVNPADKGKGVKIAILDTGIDLHHPALRIAGNVSFVPGASSGDDDNGHGTMVAGIIGAMDNGTGMAGVAPEASIYSVKVIGKNGTGDASAIVSGIEWSIENKMQILNLSFGDTLQLPPTVADALKKAYDAGILIVAGAGNDGKSGKADSIWYPAHYGTVIAVGSTGQNDVKEDFSSTGPELELMAPGADIISCNNQGTYSRGTGSSFSAPFVSGTAALLFAAGIDNNQEVRKILDSSAEDLGTPGWDTQYGYGLINAPKALMAASESLHPDKDAGANTLNN